METWLSPGKGQACWHVPRRPASRGPWAPWAPPRTPGAPAAPGGPPRSTCRGSRSCFQAPGFLLPLQDRTHHVRRILKLGLRPRGRSGSQAERTPPRRTTGRSGGRRPARRPAAWGWVAGAPRRGRGGRSVGGHPLRSLGTWKGVHTAGRRAKLAASPPHACPNGGARWKGEAGEERWTPCAASFM